MPKLITLLACWAMMTLSVAQSRLPYSTGEIFQSLKKLNTVGSVLYVAAHPDDENTRLITYMAEGRYVRTAYVSLTRGDGGQNLIGTETGENLGIIRTQELLAARRIDGGEQFFTRANDFGYSKTAGETFDKWDSVQVLSDLVYVIRRFRPDVMITRFPPAKYNYPTHGHHQASAILAEIAFDLAGDPTAFPEQLREVQPWQPRRLYWNTSTWFFQQTGTDFDPDQYVKLDAGGYNTFLGKSYGELAGASRSQHKSQGFGAPESKGFIEEYFEYVKGDRVTGDLLGDIDLSWSRLPGGEAVGEHLSLALAQYDPREPQAIIPHLLRARTAMDGLYNEYWRTIKMQDVDELIAALTGLYFQVTTTDFVYTPGDSVAMELVVVSRNHPTVEVQSIRWPFDRGYTRVAEQLTLNEPYTVNRKVVLPPSFPVTQPYWLEHAQERDGMYVVHDQSLIGLPENPPQLEAVLQVSIGEESFLYSVPVTYSWVDRVRGELFRNLEVAPPVSISFSKPVYVFTNEEMGELVFTVQAWKDQVAGNLELSLPEGWQAARMDLSFSLQKKGEEVTFRIPITPSGSVTTGEATVTAVVEGRRYSYTREHISYEHIPIQTHFHEATARLTNVALSASPVTIGYIMGAGDEVAAQLEQLGYQVVYLTEDNFRDTDLSQLQAILIGIRAYNTEAWLPARQPQLMEYVKQGGNLIVQYQTTWGLLTSQLGPYPFTIGRERVTVEEAPLQVVGSRQQVLEMPNKLTAADYEGWVQERGLYFASQWDEAYQPVFIANDPGEKPTEGMLLMANYGEGTFMYTGISFFRQLPAGVPGAYRLLSNLIHYTHGE